jgi:nicotinamidase-related amidase
MTTPTSEFPDWAPYADQLVGGHRVPSSRLGNKKLIMTALWTGVCLAYPALDALWAGYEVFPFVDAVGGTSLEAQRAGLERIAQAGAQPDHLGFAGLSQRD